MTHEKIIKREDGSKDKPVREFNSGNEYQWQDDWDMEEQGYLNEEEIHAAKTELWMKLKP